MLKLLPPAAARSEQLRFMLLLRPCCHANETLEKPNEALYETSSRISALSSEVQTPCAPDGSPGSKATSDEEQ